MRIEISANEAGQRLDKFLRKLLKDVPLSAIFKALRKGDIRVNGKKQKEKYTLEINDVIEIRIPTPQQISLSAPPRVLLKITIVKNAERIDVPQPTNLSHKDFSLNTSFLLASSSLTISSAVT